MGQLTVLFFNYTSYVASNVWIIVKSEVEMICKEGVGDYFKTTIPEFKFRNWRKQRQTSESIARFQAEIINGTSRKKQQVWLCVRLYNYVQHGLRFTQKLDIGFCSQQTIQM